MKLITTKSENWIFFFTLCSINLNMASISGMGNVQPVFNLDPFVMKRLWCDIVDSSINYFLYVCQIMYWYPIHLVLCKPPQKNQVVLGLVIWQVM